jgi:hypothetical protein
MPSSCPPTRRAVVTPSGEPVTRTTIRPARRCQSAGSIDPVRWSRCEGTRA